MEKTDLLFFDVGLGQSIFVYPHSHPEYGMLIDCGHIEGFHPIDFLIKKNFIKDSLSNLTLTNYDHDHFSGLPYLRSKVKIQTVSFAPNLTSAEIKELKEETTDALNHLCYVKDTYIHPVPTHIPPFTKKIFHLQKHHLGEHDTNNLSQVVFIEHHGTVICIPGDIEKKGWETLLVQEPTIKDWLKRTNVFIASHHGRENGYHADIFTYCNPECIVISDKGIVHDTQKDMSALYGTHVVGSGIYLNGSINRKVLTTRNDGHLWIQLLPGGSRTYRNFSHDN